MLMFLGQIHTFSSAIFDYEDVDVFVLQVTVSDGLLEDKGNITIYINDLDEIPVLFNLPESVAVSEHHVGDVFTVNAADPESTLLTYYLSVNPSSGNLLFNINSTGILALILLI